MVGNCNTGVDCGSHRWPNGVKDDRQAGLPLSGAFRIKRRRCRFCVVEGRLTRCRNGDPVDAALPPNLERFLQCRRPRVIIGELKNHIHHAVCNVSGSPQL